ncbi:RNA-binding S4 domain-containing protein [Desulfotomaculum copahuensis]|uniref:Uncharacterized protein n=1 Tax=Desulfotomaculum copahuensis TaxID=1838280 RepID=A0A1B7LBQ5_9FIRM|nr:RNA-binding S4 domain-containing protein [Desulfotomaculum copahuensis]OAT79889.1 hypothetical protein A6M21_14685 [Desulfotomaculum copahuensis]
MYRKINIPGGIRLGQFLKWAGVAATGGHGKLLIQSGAVRVNGRVETRRGYTLQNGDLIETGGRQFEVVSAGRGD